ncbi:MAG: SUMF1/EgtB/PvdO family nonheme iron enzyme [Methylococcales bacterium]|nr:SUMF1/EgtB/PvdO family nonheme iron enzyme [Methylococcales bacterium]
MDFKKLFSQTSNKAEAGSRQDITKISGIKDSSVEIINNYYGTDSSVSKEELKRAMDSYLGWLIKTCTSLDWFDQVAVDNENAPSLTLESVYTALLTTGKKDHYASDRQAYSAVDMLNQHKKLVIAGAPGSGKSAFVNFVCLCMAGELLQSPDHPQCNLNLLTQPLPDDEGTPQAVGQAWQHGALVPVRIILRDFVSSVHFPQTDGQVTAKAVLNFIELMLRDNNKESFFPILKKCLDDGKVLVMFDGLDEVPEAGQRRTVMKNCITAFYTAHDQNHFLVTVRPYAYEQPEWKLKEFKETMLANFSRGQIAVFINGWYRDCPELDQGESERRIERLNRAIDGNKKLKELAERPLLLTLIAFLHRKRNELPEERADLYKRLLFLLIEKWETARFKVVENDVQKALQLEQKGLAGYLQVGFDSIHQVLERLAFTAHAQQDIKDKGTADIAGRDLNNALCCLARAHSNQHQEISPLTISDYLRDRVGILYQRGGNSDLDAVYTFPHRSFQEYLAACYFSRGEDQLYAYSEQAEDWYEIAALLGTTDYDRWREVVVLAGAIQKGKEEMANLLKALYAGIDDEKPLTVAQSWGLRLAGEILAENFDTKSQTRALKHCQLQLQNLLPKLLATETLSAAERVTAGRHLAKIGDIRSEIKNVDAMQFCLIPAGEFSLGIDKRGGETKNAGLLNLDYTYAIARFPVSVAQYRQFVTASNHQMEDADCLRGLDNKPVVEVSWGEAIKFCDWLTDHWRQAGYLPEGWRVDLASEPEWEKAARGGLQIPIKPEMMTVVEMKLMTASHAEEVDNPQPQRLYPWGNVIDTEKLNYAESHIYQVSSLGCYPSGKSPYGCEEMAGNVWEWTRSAYQENYPSNHREWQGRNARKQKGAVRRVLRGGAFDDTAAYGRCAARYYITPYNRNYDFGFRVVLCPHTSER